MKTILFFVSFCCSLLLFNAQNVIVSGTVKNGKGKPLKGIQLTLKNTYDGTVSDSLGKFEFQTNEKGEHIIEASGIGFTPIEQKINLDKDNLVINFILRKTVNELEAVTITAGSFEANDKKRAAVLKPLDIVTTAGANADISATMQTLPGAQRVGESEGLFIRGGSAEESKIIIDGTVVNNFFFSSVPGIAQRGRFSPFLFNNTAFSTGGYSALYGQALSAVLNLESVDLPDETEIQAGFSPIFANIGFQCLSKNKKFGYGASYSYANLTLYMMVIQQKQDFFIPPTAHNMDFNYRYKLKKGIIKTYFYGNQSTTGIKYTSLDSLDLKNVFKISNANFFGNVSWKQLLKNSWKTYLVASYSYNKDDIFKELQNQSNEKVKNTGDPTFDNAALEIESIKTMAQIRAVLEKKLKGISAIRFGAENWYNEDKNRYHFDWFNFENRMFENYTASFVESDIYLSNKFALRPGLRYEYTNLTKKYNLAPRFSMSYQLSKNTQTSFDYGMFYQTPNRDYLLLATNFNFSRADHYILTFQHISKLITFRTQIFYKGYYQLVKTDPSNRYIINTDGKGYAQGIELFFRDKKTFKGLDYWISYSYLDTKRDYLNYPSLARPTFSAPHTGSIVIKKFWPKKMFGINWSYNWALGRPYYNPNKGADEFLTDRTPFYNSNNFSFNWIKSVKKTTMVFVVGVNNVFYQKQVFNYNYSSKITDENGLLIREEVGPPARMSIFVGVFASWGVDRSQQNINNNL
ncbi:MAG: TonB-dependent receptor [Flavobacteriia bacterium]|nr:TonB-dependent receptor [Flavobacteriia bacterium]